MCGIIFGANIKQDKEETKPVNDWVLTQFEDQFKRGTEGFGLIFIQENGEYKIERACEPYKMLMDLRDKKNKAPIILMHHRTPTSSENKMQETHPILVDNGSLKFKYLGVHNGVISNDNEMKEAHEKLGFVYTTTRNTLSGKEEFNDTECLIIELARYIEKQIDKIAIEGGGSFVILQIDKKTDKVKQVFYGRTSMNFPLRMAKDRKKVRISSEGEGNDIATETLYSFAINDFKIEKRKLSQKAEVRETNDITDYNSYGCRGYNRHGGQKDFILSEGIAIINGKGDIEKPTDQDQREAMIEEIYDKAEEANDAALATLDLYTFENELTEKIGDELKIMEIDARKESLAITLKVYNAIKECQANFLEAMLKEEKIYTMMPQTKPKDEGDKDISSLAPRHESGFLITPEHKTGFLEGELAEDLEAEEAEEYRKSQLSIH